MDMDKTVLKKVYINSDHSEGIGWYSRRWDIPESELMSRALTALARGVIPTQHLLTQEDRERMRQSLLKRWEEGQTIQSYSPSGERMVDRKSINEERINRRLPG